ncbi:phage tail protein [Marinisporobacter balticus]|uniref:Microcystin-dependent protein n=1 Tax=Marinisporobacter balticus TaxID=2018667 RepID=A0A4R2KJ27_9FIRM|nr:tail fiber protein [Marinisporobacter balticus]TCO70008.1 microcystin-dependent protein [Marinisporobacter balticus]
MGEPFLGEIRIFGFNFPPRNWACCNGQLLPMNQNQALFALLGTAYGGDGHTTFALPDLRGRVPIHRGDDYSRGERGGLEEVTLSVSELPAHTHTFIAQEQTKNTMSPTGAFLGIQGSDLYANPNHLVTMAMNTVTNTGDGASHYNMQPALVLNFCIALTGVFPPRN